MSRVLRNVPTVVLALIVPVIVVVTVVVTLGATSSPTTSGSVSGGGSGTSISIRNFAFSPATLHAKAGSTITVTNDDSTTHTLSADDHSFDTGNLAGGARRDDQAGRAGSCTRTTARSTTT